MAVFRIGMFWDRLSERERKLAGVLGLFMGALLIFLLVFTIHFSLSDISVENEERAEAIRMLEKKSSELIQFRDEEEMYERIYSEPPPPLRSLLSNTAKTLNITIPDLKERPDQPHGEKWIEHSMEARINRIDLASLVMYMVMLESNRKDFPIAITSVSVRKHRRKNDEFDFKIQISTYERKDLEPATEETGEEESYTEEG